VVGTDRLATIQERVAKLYARSMPLRILKPPIPFPSMQWVLQWHEHQSSDPSLRWFREAVLSTAQRHLRDSTLPSRMPQLCPQMPFSVDTRS
jgi:LysR family nod box-dependent transcriptional activator